MSLEKLLTEDLRLVLLRGLFDVPGYSHNESILQRVAGTYAHRVSRDRIRTELSWLKEQGLITTEEVCGYLIATLTVRGADVAQGNVTVPGVQRPAPKG